jgi:hypothetical protein
MNKRIRKKRIRQLLLAELAVRFSTPEDAVAWLETPHAGFEGRTPHETIKDGEVERVTLALEQMPARAASQVA